jgi:hypothetical protein
MKPIEIDKERCLQAARREGDSEVGAGALAMDPIVGSFVEETCNCGRVWRGKPGYNPAKDCPDCGEDMEREAKWRRDNHYP